MASNTYFDSHPLLAEHHQQQYLHSQSYPSPGTQSVHGSGQSSPLIVTDMDHYKPQHHHRLIVTDMDHYKPQHHHRTSLVDFAGIKKAHEEDATLKARIRRLRVLSRVIAFLLSVAVFIPITLTLHKFLSTQNVFRDVTKPDGTTVSRNAWAKDTKAWPTWMYFLVAGISVLLNFVILFAYKFGVESANKAAYVATVFQWITMLGNLAVWSVAASLYRSEKDKNGKSNDLWGWTCSAPAKAIQKEFAGDVNFNQYCNVQSVSFYIGLVQVGAALLTVFINVLVLMRKKSKKNLKRQSQFPGQYPSNY